MKLKVILPTIFSTLIFSNISLAQNNFSVNHFSNPAPIETDEFTIEFFDILCEKEYAKGRLKITNKTNDFLVYDQSLTKGIFPSGEVSNEKGKEIYIDPFKSASRTFNFTGKDMKVEAFTIILAGIYRVPVSGSVQSGESFILPNRVNSVTIGMFQCDFDKMTKVTDKLEVSFKCKYLGTQVGLIDPSKASFTYPNANEYANADGKPSIEIMEQGDSKKVSFRCAEHKSDGDLQFIEMKLNWKNCFVESKKQNLSAVKVECKFDLAKTVGKN